MHLTAILESSLSWSSQLPVCESWTLSTATSVPPLPQQGGASHQSGWGLPNMNISPMASALSLSPATEPLPRKLVDRILTGHFIEMRDLLTDNISLLQQLEILGTQPLVPALPGFLKPRLHEVSALPSWLYCYLAYVTIRSPDPATRDRLSYARLLIREAQRHGGTGWIDYDRVFCQHAQS